MPVPSHMTYSCPACGWSKTVTPKSDALIPGDFYDCCPNCGHDKLDVSKASFAAQVISLLDKMKENISGTK